MLFCNLAHKLESSNDIARFKHNMFAIIYYTQIYFIYHHESIGEIIQKLDISYLLKILFLMMVERSIITIEKIVFRWKTI